MGNILVIRGGAIGDFILTLPVLELLRQGLPDNRIAVLGNPGIASLASHFGLADEVRSMHHASLARFFIPPHKANHARIQGELDPDWCQWFQRFDLILSYLHDEDGAFQHHLESLGISTYLQGPSSINEASPLHATAQLAQPLESLALFYDPPTPSTPPSASPSAKVAPVTHLALHPGSGGLHKTWSLEHWIELAHWLIETFPHITLHIFTGEAEEERGFLATMREAWRDLPIQYHHSLPLEEVAKQLKTIDFYLGHDSGIAHLAAYSGLPSLLLFGPTNPRIWAPIHPATSILRAPEGQWQRLSTQELQQEILRKIG